MVILLIDDNYNTRIMARSCFRIKYVKILIILFVLIIAVVLFKISYVTERYKPLSVLKITENRIVLSENLSLFQEAIWKDYGKVNLYNVSISSDNKTTMQTLHDVSASLEFKTTVPNQSSNNQKYNSCPKKIAVTDIKRNEIPLELYKIAPNVFDKVPSTFLNGTRSPCWKRKGGHKMFCLPSFFLTGVGKCGTTDIWHKVVKHPEIVNVLKEPRWWARGRLGRGNGRRDNKPVPVEMYFKHFVQLAKRITKTDVAAKTLIAGDGSPSTYWDNMLWKDSLTSACANATTPLYVISDVFRAILPKSKFLTVFRNPADRLYSDYLFDNKSCTREYFHQSVVKTTGMFHSCLGESSRRACIYNYFSHAYDTRKPGRWDLMRLYKGLYSVFITDWLDAFPRDQLMFIRLEDWHRNCEEMLPDIYRFLGLTPLSRNWTNSICSSKTKNTNYVKMKKGPMLEKTRVLLNEFYKSSLQELAELLRDDRFLWAD